MKYVVVRSKRIGTMPPRRFPIIFPNGLSHADVAKAILEGCPELKDGEVVSAGSVSSMAINSNYISPEGSTTLKMKQGMPSDPILIPLIDYSNGVGDD